MKKKEIRDQIIAMGKKRADDLHKKWQNIAEGVRKQRLEEDGSFAVAYRGYIKASDDISRHSKTLIGLGVEALTHGSSVDYYFRQSWTVPKLEIVERGYDPTTSALSNTILRPALDNYRREVVLVRKEYDKLLEVLSEMPAKKAFDLFIEAGLPLKEIKEPENLPATNLLLDLKAITGGHV